MNRHRVTFKNGKTGLFLTLGWNVFGIKLGASCIMIILVRRGPVLRPTRPILSQTLPFIFFGLAGKVENRATCFSKRKKHVFLLHSSPNILALFIYSMCSPLWKKNLGRIFAPTVFFLAFFCRPPGILCHPNTSTSLIVGRIWVELSFNVLELKRK